MIRLGKKEPMGLMRIFETEDQFVRIMPLTFISKVENWRVNDKIIATYSDVSQPHVIRHLDKGQYIYDVRTGRGRGRGTQKEDEVQ